MDPQPGHVRLFRAFGADVQAHVLLLPLLGLFTWVFATRLLPSTSDGATLAPAAWWGLGAAASLGLAACSLLQELARAWVARRVGAPLRRVSVLLPSAHDRDVEAQGPWPEFLVAATRPIVTLTLAALAWVVAMSIPAPWSAVPGAIAAANLVLAGCHALPGFPLDGGHALRAVLWGLANDRLVGTRWACRASQGFAILLGISALLLVPVAGAAWILFALLALVLFVHASITWRRTRTAERLRGLTARDVMAGPTPPVPRVTSVTDALTGVAMRGDRSRAFLVEWNGRLGGIVTFAALRRVPPEERDATPVGQVTEKLRREHVLAPTTLLETALRRMLASQLPVLPVVDDGNLVGVVRRDAILRVIAGEDPLVVRLSSELREATAMGGT